MRRIRTAVLAAFLCLVFTGTAWAQTPALMWGKQFNGGTFPAVTQRGRCPLPDLFLLTQQSLCKIRSDVLAETVNQARPYGAASAPRLSARCVGAATPR